MSDPRAVYSQLLKQRRAEIAALDSRHRWLGYARLAAVVIAAVMVWQSLSAHALSMLWVLAPLAVFIALIVVHERLLGRMQRYQRSFRFFERAIARLDGDWAGKGETGDSYSDAGHPYAQDLDLFGRGSLFELLCAARTHIGGRTLAGWLLHPADPETIAARQQAIDELRSRLDLREQLAVVAEEARTGVNPASLAEWGEGKGPSLDSRRLSLQVNVLAAFGLLAAIGAVLLLAQLSGELVLSGRQSFLLRDAVFLILATNGYFLYAKNRLFGAAVSAVEEAAHELGLLSDVLTLLEAQTFRSPLLVELRASLDYEGGPPSRHLAELKRLVEYLDSRDNVLVRLLEVFILWTPHWALRVERWRKHSGPAVRKWLQATGDMEALSSLASHAFEHPDDVFPEVLSNSGPCFRAAQIAHPILPVLRAVRNDVEFGSSPRVLVVSGSNMSGKSTLLRTVGINLVLAQAGATVRAAKLTISPMSIGASIRVTDSLREGISRFYAEILRLRQILDLTSGPRPVLFLIDEFLHGTNSHDRRLGAEGMVRGLLKRGAAGLITTHDLALAAIVERLGEQGANVHFEDHLENGKIRFDYIMRPGVVSKSNALELMRSVGLDTGSDLDTAAGGDTAE